MGHDPASASRALTTKSEHGVRPVWPRPEPPHVARRQVRVCAASRIRSSSSSATSPSRRRSGCKQRLRCAVNDRLGIEPEADRLSAWHCAARPAYRVIFTLLYGLGLRVGEVTRLCVGDVDLTRALFDVRTAFVTCSSRTYRCPRVKAVTRPLADRRSFRIGAHRPRVVGRRQYKHFVFLPRRSEPRVEQRVHVAHSAFPSVSLHAHVVMDLKNPWHQKKRESDPIRDFGPEMTRPAGTHLRSAA